MFQASAKRELHDDKKRLQNSPLDFPAQFGSFFARINQTNMAMRRDLNSKATSFLLAPNKYFIAGLLMVLLGLTWEFLVEDGVT